MQDYIEIKGGIPLKGTVKVGGAKNAVLPMLIASLLTDEQVVFNNVPNLQDVSLLINLIEHFGGKVDYVPGCIKVQTSQLISTEASYSLVKAMRASFWVLGPVLVRAGSAQVALPGGDVIGVRPVDLHIEALQKMGAEISVRHGVVYASNGSNLKACDIDLRFPSVGATHQILLTAALVPGRTRIFNAAREPEIVALADMLTAMGAKVTGQGTSEIIINGANKLSGTQQTIIGDRIEAATYLCSGLITNGEVQVSGFDPSHLGAFIDVLKATGATLEIGADFVKAHRAQQITPVTVATGPFPELATDIQAPLMAYLTIADGVSVLEENIFEGRFSHVAELTRMGANIQISGKIATIQGVKNLSGAAVQATDIRAAAALVIAALAAEGSSQIHETQHIRRGYGDLENKMRLLGGDVSKRLQSTEDYLYTGC